MVHDWYLNNNKNKLRSFAEWKMNKSDLDNIPFKKQIEEWLKEVFIIPLAAAKKEMMKKTNRKETDIDYKMFYPSKDDFHELHPYLPPNTVLIKISFTLKKPYISKDDSEFHLRKGKIIENPLVRDRLTGLPMVKPSTWKGHLRYAATKGIPQKAQEETIKKKVILNRLFGSETENTDALRGRLYFFPTFFDTDPEDEIITPLDREKRIPVKGRSPVFLEKVDSNKKGELHLLYFPYPQKEDYHDSEAAEDLGFLAKSLRLMLYTYGFSAKKTSGFGVIDGLREEDIEVTPEGYKKYFLELWESPAEAGGES